MATFSKTGFKTLNYNSFRPHYPPSFYQILSQYGRPDGSKFGKTLDIGCGTGIATYELLNFSEKVVGIDLSPKMIDTCNSLVNERCEKLEIKDTSRISFSVGDLDNLNVEGGFDLIVGAQCLHWSKDFKKLFENVYKLLNPGGVFAYWYYVDPITVDYKPFNGSQSEKLEILEKVKSLYFNWIYNDPNLVGPHWEQPGRTIIKNFYKEIDTKIPPEFKDVKINNYKVDLENYVPPSKDDLILVKDSITIAEQLNYLGTYSGVHNYIEATKDTDFVQKYAEALKNETGWTDETKFDSVFNTGYTFMKK